MSPKDAGLNKLEDGVAKLTRLANVPAKAVVLALVIVAVLVFLSFYAPALLPQLLQYGVY